MLCKKPPLFGTLSVAAWAAGAIAYELFGEVNPFSHSNLDSATYQDSEIPLLARYARVLVERF